MGLVISYSDLSTPPAALNEKLLTRLAVCSVRCERGPKI